ncbi:MAG: hypothetical protein ACK41F_14560 [Fimbriimonadaceae bacterium]
MNTAHPKRPMPGMGVPYSFASQAVFLPCRLHRIPLDQKARLWLTRLLIVDASRAFRELAYECLDLESKELARWAVLWGELASGLGERWVEEGCLTIVAPLCRSTLRFPLESVPDNPLIVGEPFKARNPIWFISERRQKLEPERTCVFRMDRSSLERAADAFAGLWARDDEEIVRFVERFGSPFFPFGPVLDPVDLIRRESHKFACFRRLRRVLASCEGSIPSDREVESAMRGLWLRHDAPSVPPEVLYTPEEWILTHHPPPNTPSRLSTCKPSYFAGLDASLRASLDRARGTTFFPDSDIERLLDRIALEDGSYADSWVASWAFHDLGIDLGFGPYNRPFEVGSRFWPSTERTTAGQIRVWMFRRRLPRSPGACAVEAVRLTLDRVGRLLWTVRSDESALRVRVVSHCLLGSLYLHETMAAAVPKPCPYFDRCGRYLSTDGTIFGQPKRRDAKTCGEPACQRRMQRETARLKRTRSKG